MCSEVSDYGFRYLCCGSRRLELEQEEVHLFLLSTGGERPAVAAHTPPVMFYARVLTHQTPTQVVITASNCCGTNETRLPYGELGNIRIASCCSCWAILSGHNLVGHKGQIAPGCFGCCQYGFLTQVHTELRTRMRARGDQVLLVVLAS